MPDNNIAIATISLARTNEEERVLETALDQLATLHLPVFITDGGSPESFVSHLKSKPHFTVLAAKGLWPQARKSITAAEQSGAGFILYTEPDKLQFFAQHLPALLQSFRASEKFGVLLASRSAAGFASFPPFQQVTETTINQCCREVLGIEADYCYGPFLFHHRLIAHLDRLPESCGWGWRPFLFAMAHRLGFSVDAFVADFACPPDQREEDGKEKIYRMKQLTQNIEGLVQATAIPLA